jgi:hypothetical protein
MLRRLLLLCCAFFTGACKHTVTSTDFEERNMQVVAILSRKLINLLGGRYSATQILQRVNRTPLRHVVKAAVTVTHFEEKVRRTRYARGVAKPRDVEDLRLSGICHPSIDIALREELIRTGLSLWRSIGEEHRRTNKGYLKGFIAKDLLAGRIDNRSIFVRFASQPDVVDLVAAYFGEAPYLSYVALDLSENVDGELSMSQLWHRDHDDTKVVKLFVYLTDVDSELNGPFNFIPPEPSARINAIEATHLADDKVFLRVPRDAVIRVTASAGAAFLVDTGRCYHMGSRVAPGRYRLMYTASYISRPAIYPNFLNTIAIKEPLSERERLLLLP